jgi:hypothetical protein
MQALLDIAFAFIDCRAIMIHYLSAIFFNELAILAKAGTTPNIIAIIINQSVKSLIFKTLC